MPRRTHLAPGNGRRGVVRALVLGLAVLGVACDDPRSGGRGTTAVSPAFQETVDDPASADADAVDLINAPDFRFTYGDGSGWHGYNVLSVAADGTAVYTFFEYVPGTTDAGEPMNRQQWRRAQFKLDAATSAALRAELKRVDFWRLKKSYHAPVHDGTQRWAKVAASGKRKGVYWNNNFPESFEQIHAFVGQKILAPNRPAITAAPVVQLDPKDVESETYD